MSETIAVRGAARRRVTPPPFSFRPFLQRASFLVETDPSSAVTIAEKALDRYYQQPESTPEDLNQILEVLTTGYWRLKQYEKATNAASAQLDAYREMGNELKLTETRANLGALYVLEGRTAEALRMYELALEGTRSMEDPFSEARIQLFIGEVYDRMDQYPEALNHYLKSLSLIDRNKREHRSHLQDCVRNIGKVHAEVGDYEKALDYWNIARECAVEEGDPVREAEVILHIAIAQAETGKVDDARRNLERALDVFREADEPEKSVLVLQRLAETHLAAGRFERAWEYCEYALELTGNQDFPEIETGIMSLLVDIFARQESHLFDPEKAMELADTALKTARRAHDKRAESVIRLKLADLEERQGRTREAVEQLRIYCQLNEEVVREDWARKRESIRIAVDVQAMRQHETAV